MEPLFDSFPPYAAAFKRRFGIHHDQALDLFHQTVSMKSVGNLTEFVRDHMLEACEVAPRIESLINHFDDLNRAHNAVLKAKKQVGLLTPLSKDLDTHKEVVQEKELFRSSRDSLRFYFAKLKAALLQKRLSNLHEDQNKVLQKIRQLEDKKSNDLGQRDHLTREIAANGGDRLERLRLEMEVLIRDVDKRKKRAGEYQELAASLELPMPDNLDNFLHNSNLLSQRLATFDAQESDLQNQLTERSVEFRTQKAYCQTLDDEIQSLKKRRSNIDSHHITLRDGLCQALNLNSVEMPFIGELLQIHEQDCAWEGAAERLLHNFGLSLLVPDRYYSQVSDWVERTHLKGRLVYYRVPKNADIKLDKTPQPDSLIHKIQIKPDSEFYSWIEHELLKRFDYRCCETMDDFRKSHQAIRNQGKLKLQVNVMKKMTSTVLMIEVALFLVGVMNRKSRH